MKKNRFVISDLTAGRELSDEALQLAVGGVNPNTVTATQRWFRTVLSDGTVTSEMHSDLD